MNRNEFLQELKTALENDLTGIQVQENIEYYSNYIGDEVRNGKIEQDVLAELGDPWMIAHTVIEAEGNSGHNNLYEANESKTNSQNNDQQQAIHVFGLDTWWKKIGTIAVIIVAIVAILGIVTGFISLVAPILMPIFIIVMLFKIFGRRR